MAFADGNPDQSGRLNDPARYLDRETMKSRKTSTNDPIPMIDGRAEWGGALPESAQIEGLKEYDAKLLEKIQNLERRIENLENATDDIKPEQPAKEKDEIEDNFLRRASWVDEQGHEYPGEVIAFREADDGFEILAHSNDESVVVQEI